MPGQFASTPIVANVTLADANTEYSYHFPNGTTHFEFQARTAISIRFAFVTGKVATPVAPYASLKAGDAYSSFPQWGSQDIYLYLATAGTNVEVEIITWT